MPKIRFREAVWKRYFEPVFVLFHKEGSCFLNNFFLE